jgi:hypothetical protein
LDYERKLVNSLYVKATAAFKLAHLQASATNSTNVASVVDVGSLAMTVVRCTAENANCEWPLVDYRVRPSSCFGPAESRADCPTINRKGSAGPMEQVSLGCLRLAHRVEAARRQPVSTWHPDDMIVTPRGAVHPDCSRARGLDDAHGGNRIVVGLADFSGHAL